jgi:formate dehydrogenase major subunit
MDRRKPSCAAPGLGVGAGMAASQLTLVRKAEAADPAAADGAAKKVEVKRTVCGHCSVGCAIDAVVENGVWVRQEPVFDSPINLGAHCAKGAAVREHGHGEYRLKYPMKLVNGKYQRISWDQALNEISEDARAAQGKRARLDLRRRLVQAQQRAGLPAAQVDVVLGHQQLRPPGAHLPLHHRGRRGEHLGVWRDDQLLQRHAERQGALYIGSNAAEAHPVSMLHMLHAKEKGCKMIVVDPRFTRTAAKADQYVRIRSGSDIPFLFGVLYHIFKNGWEDKKYIEDRVYGMDKVREEVLAKWTPDKVEEACGVDEATCLQGRQDLAENRPSTIVWCMGQTQHTIGNAMVRASCLLQLALGNVGKSGGGTNIFRGHDNVQGATDVGPNPDSLPGYYGLAEGSWKHFAKAWGVDFEWIKKQYAPGMMTKPGMTVSRWIDGVLEKNELIDQDSNLRGLFFWGHAPELADPRPGDEEGDGQARPAGRGRSLPQRHRGHGGDARQGRDDLNPNRAVYLLPACTQFETSGSVHGVQPLAAVAREGHRAAVGSRTDHMIMYQLARSSASARNWSRTTRWKGKGGLDEPEPESILREINKCVWTIGYTGQSPERLKAHMRNMNVFDVKTLRAKGGIDKETGYKLDGDYFGLPWPCYGTPELKHPGSPNLYDTSKHVMDGGGNFRANFGVERDGVSLLAADGSHSEGRRPDHRLPRVRPPAAEEAGLVGRPDRGREEGRRRQELEDRPRRAASSAWP